jgi:hypothetical protein
MPPNRHGEPASSINLQLPVSSHCILCLCRENIQYQQLPLQLQIILRHHGRSNPLKNHVTAADLHRRKRGKNHNNLPQTNRDDDDDDDDDEKLPSERRREPEREEGGGGGGGVRPVPAGYITVRVSSGGVKLTASPIWAFKSHLNHRPGISNPKVRNRTEPSDWEIEW